ncbi:hypothetical protein J5J10_16210 [Ciceribacter sp. L1K23]|uniref:hypothetical protein n=1 Tax=Ciceribacter sp. L1K23 TaxID=2820276 RepID=UPI001B832F22|nr:hypothetical protein [Ciceribacter sp. L1K23]MBR0557233.1 hypothetical protein [Ciceribacter sp. L1K23]
MSGLETAIRSALERSDRTSAEMRARIYQSARHALETGLRKQNITDPDVVEDQRHRLEAMIHEIEQEERARMSVVEPSVDEIAAAAFSFDATDPEPRAVPDVDVSPVVAAPDRHSQREEVPDDAFGGLRAERNDRVDISAAPQPVTGPREEPRIASQPDAASHSGTAGLDVRPDKVIRQRKRRSGVFSRLFILVVILASLGMGAWWIYSSGLQLTPQERAPAVQDNPPRAEEEDFLGQPQPTLGAPDTQQGFSDDWIKVFAPSQVAGLQPSSGASVSATGTGEDQAARLVANEAGDSGSIAIPFPVDVLREMAGKTSTIALSVKTAGDESVQMSVVCDFDRLGDCARHRFTVTPERGDILFRVTFDLGIAPNTPGRLVVNPGLGGAGGGIDLYEVRVLPGR